MKDLRYKTVRKSDNTIDIVFITENNRSITFNVAPGLRFIPNLMQLEKYHRVSTQDTLELLNSLINFKTHTSYDMCERINKTISFYLEKYENIAIDKTKEIIYKSSWDDFIEYVKN